MPIPKPAAASGRCRMSDYDRGGGLVTPCSSDSVTADGTRCAVHAADGERPRLAPIFHDGVPVEEMVFHWPLEHRGRPMGRFRCLGVVPATGAQCKNEVSIRPWCPACAARRGLRVDATAAGVRVSACAPGFAEHDAVAPVLRCCSKNGAGVAVDVHGVALVAVQIAFPIGAHVIRACHDGRVAPDSGVWCGNKLWCDTTWTRVIAAHMVGPGAPNVTYVAERDVLVATRDIRPGEAIVWSGARDVTLVAHLPGAIPGAYDPAGLGAETWRVRMAGIPLDRAAPWFARLCGVIAADGLCGLGRLHAAVVLRPTVVAAVQRWCERSAEHGGLFMLVALANARAERYLMLCAATTDALAGSYAESIEGVSAAVQMLERPVPGGAAHLDAARPTTLSGAAPGHPAVARRVLVGIDAVAQAIVNPDGAAATVAAADARITEQLARLMLAAPAMGGSADMSNPQ